MNFSEVYVREPSRPVVTYKYRVRFTNEAQTIVRSMWQGINTCATTPYEGFNFVISTPTHSRTQRTRDNDQGAIVKTMQF